MVLDNDDNGDDATVSKTNIKQFEMSAVTGWDADDGKLCRFRFVDIGLVLLCIFFFLQFSFFDFF